jgi:hypothetical protein
VLSFNKNQAFERKKKKWLRLSADQQNLKTTSLEHESFPYKIKRSHDKLAVQGLPKSNHMSFSRYYCASKSWQI